MSEADAFGLTDSRVNKAGNRIRKAFRAGEPLRADDLQVLDTYREWHYPALRHAQERLKRLFHTKLGIDPDIIGVSARPLKTHEAIIVKLARERTRLRTMQDIAGVRIVVATLELQDSCLSVLMRVFRKCHPRVTKDSREQADRNGYRSVHVVITLEGRHVEIQVRTLHQDWFAQIVERVDRTLGCDLKHGEGPAEWLEWLQELSNELRKADLDEPFEVPPTPFDDPGSPA